MNSQRESENPQRDPNLSANKYPQKELQDRSKIFEIIQTENPKSRTPKLFKSMSLEGLVT